MNPWWALAGMVLSFVVAWFLTRPRGTKPPTRVEECECGRRITGDDVHLVVATGGDDERLGMSEGGTFVAATFCAEHCPGGCRQGCPTMAG